MRSQHVVHHDAAAFVTQHLVDGFHCILLDAMGTPFTFLQDEIDRVGFKDVIAADWLDEKLDSLVACKRRHCDLVEQIEPGAFDALPIFIDFDAGDHGAYGSGKFAHKDATQLLLNQMVILA